METRVCPASCLCGAVRWEVDGPLPSPDPASADPMALLSMSHCHCGRCRKAHGASYATYLCAPEASFRLTAGREQIVRYPSSPSLFRPFCGQCGSVVPDGSAWSGIVGMPAGGFSVDPGLVPRAHIFVASKAPWVEIHDDLPRFDAYPAHLGMPSMDTRAPLDPEGEGPRGSCLCGAVAYVLTAAPILGRICHCSRCRRAYAAANAMNMLLPLDGVRFTRGEDNLQTFKLPDARYFKSTFCRTCGSKMPRRDEGRKITIVPMGGLDDDPGIRPNMHIFVGSKLSWDVIADGLPQFDELPPS
ncbi:MAG: GFA family protein [Byssovorax sp.]